jgi:hypothetical protein
VDHSQSMRSQARVANAAMIKRAAAKRDMRKFGLRKKLVVPTHREPTAPSSTSWAAATP